MLFISPLGVSWSRTPSLPCRGSRVSPLLEIPPSLFTSKSVLYSTPKPKVPELPITGFSRRTPPMFTLKSGSSSFARGSRRGCTLIPATSVTGLKIKISPSKTGPSLQQRFLPSVVSITQPRQTPTPQAICASILSQHFTPTALQIF